MARFTDFLAGCVVGGALLATGMVLAKWGRPTEELHVSMLKDNTGATVWAVNRETGEARFISANAIPYETMREMTREQARQAGEILARGDFVENAFADVFGGMAEGAARAKAMPRKTTP